MRYLLALFGALAIFVGFALPAQAVSVRTVYVHSTLPYPRYRVDYSVLDWNKAPYVNMYMTKSCSGKTHCVEIKQAELGTTLAGVTSTKKWYVNGKVVRTLSTIKIDYSMAKQTYYARKWVVCHELGHAVNVGHTTSNCMRDGAKVAGYPSWVAIPGSYNLSVAR